MVQDQHPPSDIVIYQSGPHGNGHGSNPWTDEAMWRAHGQITAVRQWKSPKSATGAFHCRTAVIRP